MEYPGLLCRPIMGKAHGITFKEIIAGNGTKTYSAFQGLIKEAYGDGRKDMTGIYGVKTIAGVDIKDGCYGFIRTLIPGISRSICGTF